MKIPGVEATKIKTFNGMDGVGYNAVLVIDGKPVAAIFNGGEGGPTYLRDVTDRAAVAAFEEKVKALPQEPLDMGGGTTKLVDVDVDFFLGMLVEDTIEAQRIARLCKTNAVLRLPSDPPGTYRSIKVATIDKPLRDHIAKKHPGAEMPGAGPAKAAKKPAKARAR